MTDEQKKSSSSQMYYTDGFKTALASWGMRKQEFFRLTGSTPSAHSWLDAEKVDKGVSLTMANKMVNVFDEVAKDQKKSVTLAFVKCPPSALKP